MGYLYIHKRVTRREGQIISTETRAREDSILNAEYAIFLLIIMTPTSKLAQAVM